MEYNPYQSKKEESGVPEEVEALIIKRARKVWLIPLIALASLALIGRIPLFSNTPQMVFTGIGLGIFLIQMRGLLHLNKLRVYRSQIPRITPHLVAGLIICGYPVLLFIFLFCIVLF